MKNQNDSGVYFAEPASKKQYWFVIRELTGREIKRKYARSKLGIVWSVLNPLLYMLVMSLIFSYMFRKSIDNFPVYYLIGHTIYGLFSESTRSAMTSIVDNKMLIIGTKLPKQTFILSRIYTAFLNFVYTLIPLVVIMIFFRVHISWKALLMVPDIALLMFFSVGLSYLLAILYIFFADIRHLYEIVLTIMMYLSAIFYPADSLMGFMRNVVEYNPIFIAINIARQVLQYDLLPQSTEWICFSLYALISYVIGRGVYENLANRVMSKL